MEAKASNEIKEILARLARLQADMDYMKETLDDITLSEDEINAIEEYENDKRKKKLTSHEKLKEELSMTNHFK